MPMVSYPGMHAMERMPTAIKASVNMQAGAAAVMIDVRPEHDRAQRPHQEPGPEGHQRQHQRRESLPAGKKALPIAEA